jgi:hypothetical protein
VIYVRNTHPTLTLYLPFCRGWERVLAAGATTAVSATVLTLPAVQRALKRQDIVVVTEVSRGNSAHERLRQDMSAAIRAAEQAEIDRLRQGVSIKPRRKPTARPRQRWTSERIAQFKALRASHATPDEIASALGIARSSVWAIASHLGLTRSSSPP